MASIRITIDLDLHEESRMLASKVSHATAVVCAELLLHGTKYIGAEPLRDMNGKIVGTVEVID